MKINDIQKTIIELRDALAKHELLPVMLRANDALDALEKMKPTTITDDPATWPEEGLMVLVKRPQETFVAEKATILGRKSWINEKIYWTFSAGNKWQYLPEWEG